MKKARRGGFLLGIAIAALLTLLRWLDPQPLQDLRAASLDIYQRLKPRAAIETPGHRRRHRRGLAQGRRASGRGRAHKLAELTSRSSAPGRPRWASTSCFAEPDRLSPAIGRELGVGDRPAALRTATPPSRSRTAGGAGLHRHAGQRRAAAGQGGLRRVGRGGGERRHAASTPPSCRCRSLPRRRRASATSALSGEQAGSTVREVPLLLAGGGAALSRLPARGAAAGGRGLDLCGAGRPASMPARCSRCASPTSPCPPTRRARSASMPRPASHDARHLGRRRPRRQGRRGEDRGRHRARRRLRRGAAGHPRDAAGRGGAGRQRSMPRSSARS